MAEVVGVVGSVVGIIQIATKVAFGLTTLIQDIRDAPSEIRYVEKDVGNLAAVLTSTSELSTRHNLQVDDQALTRALAEYLDICKGSMQDVQQFLEPLVQKGLGSRNPVRLVEWRFKRSELRVLHGRLNEGKASLNLTITALNGVLEGKRQEEVKAEIHELYQKLTVDFNELRRGKEVRSRIEEDIDTDSVGERRTSLSTMTDSGLIMERFLEQSPVVHSSMDAPEGSDTPTAQGSPGKLPQVVSSDAIFEAVRNQNKPLVQDLITRGAGLSARSAQGLTVLHQCAISNDAEMGELLIENGAGIDAKDYQLRSPFKLALACDALHFCELLASRGCVVSDSVEELRNLAARDEDVQGRTELLGALAKRLKQSEQCLFAHPAIRLGDVKCLTVLVESGFDPAMRDKHGMTLFFFALLHERRSVMRFLKNHGVDVNQWLSKRNIEDMDPNLPRHRDIVVRTPGGTTPLLIVTRVMNDISMTKFVLGLGADPNFSFNQNNNEIALIGACAPPYLEVATELVKAGSNPNHAGYDGRSSMYWASFCSNVELVKLLIERGGDVNHQWRRDGNTAVSVAASKGNIGVVRVLVDAGADVGVKNKMGETALDVAIKLNMTKTARFLQEIGKV
ncbi:hypothetical protein QQX98_000874 [Neonectria punicea]|uniref:Azaphilone pigments biosynthesis cluster protein L N-terminal domain-containing protein n=1 Tax=Neonectria punicea TaxID=979145 RepID=A0ABR1HR96_9HYPO